MRFLNNEINFFTSYNSTTECLTDLSYLITDPAHSLYDFATNFKDFLTWTLPITLALSVAINFPLLLLTTLPLATQFLAVNLPLTIGIAAIFTAPALYSFGLAAYHLLDLVLSPLVDVLGVITNLGTTAVESFFSESYGY